MILGVDIGTTSLKMGLYRVETGTLTLLRQRSRDYTIRTYHNGLFSDIDPEQWKVAFVAGCKSLGDMIANVEVISLSGTTPGLTAMDREGNALLPAILMLDQRSRAQAQYIIDTIGLDALLRQTGNMPVAGGCSLASILWIRDNHPDVFRDTYVFGHSNTYIAAWLTGTFAIDPSSASLTALYNTVRNDMTWNADIASAVGLSLHRLPAVMPAHESTGRVKSALAGELGFKRPPAVVIGGNDAVLAAYSLGINEPGDIVNVNGTCEITLVCLSQCVSSTNYNVRVHVIPDRWLTLHVMNAGGKALEWFHSVFCGEMSVDEFYDQFLPGAIEQWIERQSAVTYVPYLLGSRYSLEPLRAEIHGLTAETRREEILAAIVRGLCEYQKQHLEEMGSHLPLRNTIHLTGGAVSPALVRAKKRWMRNCEYILGEQSSMRGAAMLGLKYLEQKGYS